MTIAEAIKAGDADLLPSRRDEDWRWTDLRGLIRELPAPSSRFEGELGPSPFGVSSEITAKIVNGFPNAVITVAQGAERVDRLRIVAREAGAHAAWAEITVKAGGKLVLLESYEGDAGDYLSETTVRIRVEADAELERIVLAADGVNGVSVSRAEVALGARAKFRQTVVTTGARRQRLETRVKHPGHGAQVRMDGVYLLDDRRHADITTEVIHAGVDGVTDQLVKGVVGEQGRAVFQGRIVVKHGADKTDARMGHHALLLSDRAEVDAKPELEIYADDVACAHGNTVGDLDEDALFYAAQRGIPDAEGRAMLTEAFLREVADRIGHEPAREAVLGWIAERLAGG